MPGEVLERETIFDSVRDTLGEAWSGLKGMVRGSRDASGYSQLPVEMSESV